MTPEGVGFGPTALHAAEVPSGSSGKPRTAGNSTCAAERNEVKNTEHCPDQQIAASTRSVVSGASSAVPFQAARGGRVALLPRGNGLELHQTTLRGKKIDMAYLDTVARYLMYAFIVDFSLEMLDLVHRIYESDESFQSLDFMVHSRLYTSQIVIQIILGTLVPIGLLALTQLMRLTELARKTLYSSAAVLTLIGIFAMRWNVVIGGQLFSKSFLGYTTYKMDFATREGLLPAILCMVVPLLILWALIKVLPPSGASEQES